MRRYHEEVWRRHLEHCLALGLDPTLTPVNFEATPFAGANTSGASPVPGSAAVGYPPNALPVFWDPLTGTWQPYPEDAALPASATALTPLSETSTSQLAKVPPAPLFPILQLVVPPGYDPTVMGPLIMDFECSQYEPSCGTPLVPGSLVVPLTDLTSAETAPDNADAPEGTSDSGQSASSTGIVLPSVPTLLPRFWRRALDDRGRMYYFHVRFRIPQWEPPTPEEETPEFSSEDEEAEEEESVPVENAAESHPVDQNPKEAERSRRRNLLCQERIISPRSDFERSDDAQKYRELKERVLRLKLSRIRERGLLNVEEKKVSSMPNVKSKRKLSEKEKEKLRKKAKEKHKRLMNSQRKKMKTEKESIRPDKLPTSHPHDEDEPTADLQGQHPEQVQAEPEAAEEESLRYPVVNGSFLSMDDDLLNLRTTTKTNPQCRVGRISCTEDFKHLARKVSHLPQSSLITIPIFDQIFLKNDLKDYFKYFLCS